MFRNILTIITISFFIMNCTFFTNYGRDYQRSHNESLNQNYDKAIDYCINSLKRNPNYKKSKIMYEKIVPLAINFYHSNIDTYLNDKDNQKKLIESYDSLFKLIEKLEKASISKNYKKYLRTDYNTNYEEALINLADYHYKKRIDLMSYEEKDSYKAAYNEFILSNYYKDNYKDSNKYLEECRKNSIFHITIMDFENNSKKKYDFVGNTISNKLIADLQSIPSFTEIVDIVDRKNMNIIIEQLKISDSGLIEDSLIELGEIKEIDHIVRGEINKIIINDPKHTTDRVRYNNSNGSFGGYKTHHKIEAYLLIDVYLEIIDVETSEIINSKTFREENNYVDKWTTGLPNTSSVSNFLVDVALTAILNKGNKKDRKQITSDEMLNAATNKINGKIKNHIKLFYK